MVPPFSRSERCLPIARTVPLSLVLETARDGWLTGKLLRQSHKEIVMSIAKVMEITAESDKSFEDAIQ